MKITKLTKNDLLNELNNLGVKKGDLLNVKASLSSIGYIENGANTLLEALIESVGEKGTIVTDSFVYSYPFPLSNKNKYKYSNKDTPSYAGALANAMINHPKNKRSNHPIQKFSAIGAMADFLTQNHNHESYAYEVLKLMSTNRGKNLKIGSDIKVVGVGTTHVAIGMLELKQKREKSAVRFKDENGEVQTFRPDWSSGCGNGFNNFIPIYDKKGAIIHKGKIGNAEAKITDMKKTLDIEIEEINKNNKSLLCDKNNCIQCQLTWDFYKISIIRFFWINKYNLSLRLFFKALKASFFYTYPIYKK